MNLQEIPENQIIRRTTSTCPVCQAKIEAKIVEKTGKVFMVKHCPNHGEHRIQLSQNAAYYKTLNDLYFSLFEKPKDHFQYFLYFTNQCNLKCPICLMGNNHWSVDELSLEEIKGLVLSLKDKNCMLYGAEPTCREDLPEIINLIKNQTKSPSLFTNGLKFIDKEYVEKIKKAGVGLIFFQFDGFRKNSYSVLRNRDILDQKLKALANLESLNMPIVLNVTLAKDVNADELYDMILYSLKRDFIKAICIITLTNIGDTGDDFVKYSLNPDDCIESLQTSSSGRINRDYLRRCQKLLYLYKSWFKMRSCFFVNSFILFQTNEDYLTLDDIFDKTRLEHSLDKTVTLMKKSQFLAKVYLSLSTFFLILSNMKSFKFFISLIPMVFNGLAFSKKKNRAIKPLVVGLTTGCDQYKFDFQVINRCGTLFAYKKDGKIVTDDSLGCHMFKNSNDSCCSSG